MVTSNHSNIASASPSVKRTKQLQNGMPEFYVLLYPYSYFVYTFSHIAVDFIFEKYVSLINSKSYAQNRHRKPRSKFTPRLTL